MTPTLSEAAQMYRRLSSLRKTRQQTYRHRRVQQSSPPQTHAVYGTSLAVHCSAKGEAWQMISNTTYS